MSENNKTYNSYSSNNLNPGHKLEIEHTVYSNITKLDISNLTALSVDVFFEMVYIHSCFIQFNFNALNFIC